MPKYNDLAGMRFGRLTAVSISSRNKHGQITWNVKCDCGGTAVVTGGSLRTGNTASCGCIQREWSREFGSFARRGNTAAVATKKARAVARAAAILAAGEKRCTNKLCTQKNPQPLRDFARHTRRIDGHVSWCKTCWRSKQRSINYGIDQRSLEMMLEEQGFRCANRGCGTAINGDHATCVDHDHATGAIRGLLCKPCNTALGILKDSPKILRGLLAFATEHSQLRVLRGAKR